MAMSQRMWKREQERKRRERQRRARRRRNCAIAVVVLAVVAVCAIVSINKNDGAKSKPKPAPETAQSAVESIAANPYETTRTAEDIKKSFFKDAAFAGNALAETIGMYGILDETNFYAGVNVDVENVYTVTPSGSTTSIAEQFKSKRFSKIFLAFGEKELSSMTSSEFKSGYRKLVEKIKKYQPDIRIYLIGIPPVTAKTSETDKYVTMGKIKEFNKRIISLAVDEELYYVDSVDALGDNKNFLPAGVSYDGINLNKAAVTDLLYYMTKGSYIPDAEDISDDDMDDEDDEEEKATAKPKKTAEPSPSPTVNVFKDKQKKGDTDE